MNQRAILLVEENLRLRALLLGAFSRESSSEQIQNGGPAEDSVGEKGERDPSGEDGIIEANESESLAVPLLQSESRASEETSTVQEGEREQDSGTDGSGKEQESDSGRDEKGGDETEANREEGARKNGDVRDKQLGKGNSEAAEGDSRRIGGREGENDWCELRPTEIGSNRERESSAVADQSWPMSSLLSDATHRDHHQVAIPTSSSLPILSPTYIAEHCSSSGGCSEQQFFGPHSGTLLLPPSVAASGGSGHAGQRCGSGSLGRELESQTAAPVSSAPKSGVCVPGLSSSDVSQFLTESTTFSSSVLPAALSANPQSHPTTPMASHQQGSSLPRQSSIVQPWVGSSTTNRNTCRTELSGRNTRGSVTSYTARSHQAQQRSLLAQSQPQSSSGSHQHRALYQTNSASWHSRYTSHSVSDQGHSHTLYNQQTPQNRGRFGSFPSTDHSFGRSNLPCDQPYYSVGASALPPFTLSSSPFLAQTTPPLLSQSSSQQRQLRLGFSSSSSIDHFYHCGPAAFEPQPSAVTSFPLPHCHTSQSHMHPHFLPHTPTHHYPHQSHSYPGLPPAPSHLLPPHFPPHQHTPSHHSTVWRPYSERRQTSASRFNLSDILSPSPSAPLPSLGLPQPVVSPPPIHQQARIPSFFVDHLLDDL